MAAKPVVKGARWSLRQEDLTLREVYTFVGSEGWGWVISQGILLAINGIFVLAELTGEAAELVREIQLEFDPKLAATRGRPHVTIAGSSGVGPVPPDTSLRDLESALAPVAASTPPLVLEFGPPTRFMQTNIVMLPLDPNGPLRELHEKIVRSGLSFTRARFTFSPHATLSLYPTLSSAALKRVLAMRVEAPARLESLSVYHTMDPQPSKKLLELPFQTAVDNG